MAEKKVGNGPELRAFKWCVTYCLKVIDKGYNFALNLALIKDLQKKWYGFPKLRESQFQEFQDSPLRNLGENDIWVQRLWLVTKNTITRKVVASPRFRL